MITDTYCIIDYGDLKFISTTFIALLFIMLIIIILYSIIIYLGKCLIHYLNNKIKSELENKLEKNINKK